MAVKTLVGELTAERKLMLLLIAIDRIGRANPGGSVPNHVLVPGPGQPFARKILGRAVIIFHEISYHYIP